jgi:dTDP-4-amino-4,6-dideoxygalactose transaminase
MRMGGLEGASLSVKLRHLDSWNQKRRAIAAKYQSEIKNPKVVMQVQPPGYESVFHLFVVTTANKDEFLAYLTEHNILPGQHYPVPCHLQKAYSHLNYKKGDCPNAEYLAAHCLSLPMYAELTDEEVNYVIETINKY